MRGFFLGALVLVGLDLLLTSTASGLTGAAALPAQWLAKWMSPAVPLITAPVPVSSAGASTSGAPAASSNTNQLGESTTGACPPGFPPGLKCAAM